MSQREIYLDHAATTATDPRVVEAMLPYFSTRYGNPSSVYRLGTLSLEGINRARETVADALGANRNEIIFTSGGSEANNLAIKGCALSLRDKGRGMHVITTAIEHHATLHAVEQLTRLGFTSTVLPVDRHGLVSVDAVREALRPDTLLVSVMYANNEIGTVQPIAALGALCRERGVLFHVDAVQAVGALPVDVTDLAVDLLSITGHKFYGPKGTGALYVRNGITLWPQISGGGQERKQRAGTENVPGIVGMGEAVRIAVDERQSASAHCRALRDRLIEGVKVAIPDCHLNGHPTERLPNNVHFTFARIEGERTTESLLTLLDHEGIYASTGSACNSRTLQPSHVLSAIGLSAAASFSSVRLTVGRENTVAEIDEVLTLLPSMVARLRSLSVGTPSSAASTGAERGSPRSE